MSISSKLFRDKMFLHFMLAIVIILAIISTFYTYCLITNANQSEIEENIYIEDTFSDPIVDIAELLDHNMTGLVYVGRDSCPECLIFNRIMQEEILQQYPALTIYKFDTSVWAEHKEYQKVLDIYGITSIPTVIFLRDDGTYEKILMDNMSGQEIVQKMLSLIESEELCY